MEVFSLIYNINQKQLAKFKNVVSHCFTEDSVVARYMCIFFVYIEFFYLYFFSYFICLLEFSI